MHILQFVLIGIAFLLSVAVITRNPGDRNRWLLFLFNSSVCFWILTYIVADVPSDMSLLWNKLVFAGALFMGYAGYLLIASMANRVSRVTLFLSITLGLWLAIMLSTPLVVASITPRMAAGGAIQGFDVVHGPAYLLYVLSLLATGIGLIAFIFRMRRKAKGRLRSQLQIIFGGFIGLLVAGVLTGVLLPVLLHTSEPANYSFL